MNLAQLLIRAGRSHAARPAIYQGTKLLCNYGELAERVERLATGLRGKGLVAGDRVALIMKNCPEYVQLMFACWHAGLVVVPVNAKLHAKEFQYLLDHSGARGCFVSPSLAPALAEIRPQLTQLEWILEPTEGCEQLCESQTKSPMTEVKASDVAWLFYTSGTTGRPKGAMLSHRNLLAMTLCYASDVDAIQPGDCVVHAAPMSHGSGLYILPHVAAAAAQVIPDSGGFEPEEIFELLSKHRGVSFFAAPTMVCRLMNHPRAADIDYTNLKSIIYGGGPMYSADAKTALSVFGNRLVQIYGQGESPMTITALGKPYFAEVGHASFDARLASVGVPQTGIEVIVADEGGTPLPDGETGEVLVRGDSVMVGYWKNPKASAETLKGGWLHTGDMGAIDAEGFLTLKDRSKDVIISGGTNIYPREVEEVLLRDHRLLEAAVIGRPHPDWGEEVVAFCVIRQGAEVSAAELEALCLEHIARFKRPKDYYFLKALPKNNYGKILKTELHRMLEDAQEAS